MIIIVAAAMGLMLGSMAGYSQLAVVSAGFHFAASGVVIALVTGPTQMAFWLCDPGGFIADQWTMILLSRSEWHRFGIYRLRFVQPCRPPGGCCNAAAAHGIGPPIASALCVN